MALTNRVPCLSVPMSILCWRRNCHNTHDGQPVDDGSHSVKETKTLRPSLTDAPSFSFPVFSIQLYAQPLFEPANTEPFRYLYVCIAASSTCESHCRTIAADNLHDWSVLFLDMSARLWQQSVIGHLMKVNWFVSIILQLSLLPPVCDWSPDES